jgi:vesicle coat complex subunit
MDIRRISIHPMLKTLLSGLKLKQIHTLQYFEKEQKIKQINNAFLVDFHKQKPKLLHNDQNYTVILKQLKVTPTISKKNQNHWKKNH